MKQNANNPISKNILMALENAHLIYNQVRGIQNCKIPHAPNFRKIAVYSEIALERNIPNC